MSGLPWVRMDSNWATHDKILTLTERKQWQAIVVWNASIGWCGGHGTAGHVPRRALGYIHGTERIAEQLVAVRLWEVAPDGDGWIIRNWDHYQADLLEYFRLLELRKEGGRKGGIASGESRRAKAAQSNGHGP